MRLYTLTPNPALDLSGHVGAIVPNEKNYVKRPRLDPGGNGINAARIAHRLGLRETVALGFAGGDTGKQLRKLLARDGIRERFTPIQESVRINVTVTNDSDQQQTRLAFPGPTVSREEIARLFAAVQRLKPPGIFVMGGSLPSRCPSNLYSKLASIAQSMGLGVMADVPARHLRPLLKQVRSPLLLIKPNQAELEELVGRELKSDLQIALAARELTRKSALVCVSLGKRGALLVTKTNAWFGQPPRVKTRGSVGAGDSLVGALAFRILKNKITDLSDIHKVKHEALLDALAWGLAAGAATASTEGTALGTASQIRRLRPKARISRMALE